MNCERILLNKLRFEVEYLVLLIGNIKLLIKIEICWVFFIALGIERYV